jgi:16S rRNA A1518/A1519 N6-dimethyltransferase RsmA/KsgA/DIM1 with predicted DNA glycosylase/AP lyase activity
VETLARVSQTDLIVDIGAGHGTSLTPLWEIVYRNLAAVDIDEESFHMFEKEYGIPYISVMSKRITSLWKKTEAQLSWHVFCGACGP